MKYVELLKKMIAISYYFLGSTMTGEALAKIGQFIPRLEKVYLDDIFTDSNYILDRYIQNLFQSNKNYSVLLD